MGSHGHLLLLLLVASLLLPTLSIPSPGTSTATVNPFSPQAALLRHWSRLFPAVNMPSILLSKSSPLNATQLAAFSTYVDSRTLSAHLTSFCSAANLFCDLKDPANITHDLTTDADFANYNNKVFKKYQSGGVFGGDTFKNYSVDENVAHDSFARYGKDANGQIGLFSNYALQTNVAGSRFDNYADSSNAMSEDFRSYSAQSNVQRQDFTAYGKDSSALSQSFSSYSENSNVVQNDFKGYAADANAAGSTFSGYSTSSNVITNKFKSYDSDGNGAISQFNNYADSTNVGKNNFQEYNGGGNAGIENFNSYADVASQPENVFKSYGKGTNGPSETFSNYGNTSFTSTTTFAEYNKDGSGNGDATFTTYVDPEERNSTTFKEYFQTSTSFQDYRNSGFTPSARPAVEAGKFFRQANLVAGNRIPIPDIRDKMPRRSFLPKVLTDKLPFSSAKFQELVDLLGLGNMRGTMAKTISECERPAAKDETKRCVKSIEGMAEFAGEALGRTATVSATEGTAGWGSELAVGKVVPRNGGKETRSVSCHQSLFPYLVYYCHMVPRVMVYDVELLGPEDGKKVNEAVAICHLDTTQWSATHAAFVALGPAPGKIEVCHFIFENDFIWVARD